MYYYISPFKSEFEFEVIPHDPFEKNSIHFMKQNEPNRKILIFTIIFCPIYVLLGFFKYLSQSARVLIKLGRNLCMLA